jgi:hypothetical protein
VRFESGSRLERIEESAFSGSGLRSIEITGSVTFIDSSAFLATPMAREVKEEAVEEEKNKAEEEAGKEALNAQNR